MNKSILTAGIAAALTLASSAHAQHGVITKKLFDGKTRTGGSVAGAGGKVTSMKNITDTLELAGLSGTNPYTIGYDGTYINITNATKTTTYLKGKVSSTLVNSFASSGSYGPTFAFIGKVDYVSGAWMDQLINSMGATIKGNRLWGEFSFSGLAAKPAGAENFSMNVSGQAVPEPAEWMGMGMLASGGLALVLRRRFRSR